MASLFSLRTGLKKSNYVIGKIDFHPGFVETILSKHTFDCVLYEYWHAADSTMIFRQQGVPCVLDMHDILWNSYERLLAGYRWMPASLKRFRIMQYQAEEKAAWGKFDAIVAINRDEYETVAKYVPATTRLFYAPMGSDVKGIWQYSRQSYSTPQFAFYGGLGSKVNQACASRCVNSIMPNIWKEYPQAEIWLVGSNPPESIRALGADPRVKVTGYIDDVRSLLSTMVAVLCPWEGRYGFRSRLIEVMGLGVPVVASPDAAAGMDLEPNQGILFGATDQELGELAKQLIADPAFAEQISFSAHRQVYHKFSIENTYGRWMEELAGWLTTRRGQQNS